MGRKEVIAMKDIRNDLRERIDTIRGRKQQMLDRIAQLDEQEKMYLALLAAEQAEWEATQPMQLNMGITSQKRKTPLTNFLLNALSDGNPHSLAELANLAQKQETILFNGKSPKRTVNFALLGLKNSSQVVMLGNGFWKINQGGEDK
jgi:hypothetical protein